MSSHAAAKYLFKELDILPIRYPIINEPIHQEFIELDNLMTTIDENILFVNDIDIRDDVNRTTLLNAVQTIQNTDSIDIIPRCGCGETRENFNMGKVCPKCFTAVKPVTAKKSPNLWLRKLDNQAKFLSPAFWVIAVNAIAKNYDLFQYLSCSSYNPTTVPMYAKNLVNILPNYKRTYKNFVENVENVFEYLLSVPTLKTKSATLRAIYDLYLENKHKLYVDHIPIFNNRLFVKEQDSLGSYGNYTVSNPIDIVVYYSRVCNSLNTLTPAKKDLATVKAISGIAATMYELTGSYIGSKKGFVRKNLYGTRSHGTCRGVITPINGPHMYDELHISWSIGVTLLRYQLLNVLHNRQGLNRDDAIKLLDTHVDKYNEIINDAFNILINESRRKGIECTITRNPTLLRGSSQKVRITKIKPDVNDKTISISILICPAQNADFDGDEENVTLALDNLMGDHMDAFDLAYSALDLKKPFGVSGLMEQPDPVVSQLVMYLNTPDKEGEMDTIDL